MTRSAETQIRTADAMIRRFLVAVVGGGVLWASIGQADESVPKKSASAERPNIVLAATQANRLCPTCQPI